MGTFFDNKLIISELTVPRVEKVGTFLKQKERVNHILKPKWLIMNGRRVYTGLHFLIKFIYFMSFLLDQKELKKSRLLIFPKGLLQYAPHIAVLD